MTDLGLRIAELEATKKNLFDVLRRNGFVECDIPECNCGSWHHCFGLPERWAEISEALRKAGFLGNDTGNLPIRAIGAMVERIAELERENERLQDEINAIHRDLRGALHQRLCWKCQVIHWHAGDSGHLVRCPDCRDMDTRRIKAAQAAKGGNNGD